MPRVKYIQIRITICLVCLSLLQFASAAPDQIFAQETRFISSPSTVSLTGWAEGFFMNGISGPVNVFAMDKQGKLYAGGSFSAAGDKLAISIAKWDGSQWAPVGEWSLLPEEQDMPKVNALAFDLQGNLYAAGKFKVSSGSQQLNNLARWNGSQWEPLSEGPNGEVLALAVDLNDRLYAAGSFTSIGNINANSIASWNGSSWKALSSGLDNTAHSLAIDKRGNLYVGGYFSMAGEVSAKHAALWNGSSWEGLCYVADEPCNFTNVRLDSLGTDQDGNLYIGGIFHSLRHGVARWDGNQWETMGVLNPFAQDYSKAVYSLTFGPDGRLYATGNFKLEAEEQVSSIARWDGSRWEAVASGITDPVQTIIFGQDGSLYSGGSFTEAGGVSAKSVARWKDGYWSALGPKSNTLDARVNALILDPAGNLHAGGNFMFAGDKRVRGVASLTRSGWQALGSGVDGVVNALALGPDGSLYAGGDFTSAGQVSTNFIARWNGIYWAPLVSGMNDIVRALAVDSQGNLYAGGRFRTAGGSNVNCIARWNGRSWEPLANGVACEPVCPTPQLDLSYGVWALAVDSQDRLYAAGRFDRAGDIPVYKIARWNGVYWEQLGSGFDHSDSGCSALSALAIDSQDTLYTGGSPTYNGEKYVLRINRWDGIQWQQLSSDLENIYQANRGPYLFSLALDAHDNLYAGGAFDGSGDTHLSNLARWNGSAWEALGEGVNSAVYALAVDRQERVYAGGNFTTAGGQVSLNFAVWGTLEPRLMQLFLPFLPRQAR